MRSSTPCLAAFALALSLLPLASSQILSKDATPTAYLLKVNASDLATSDTFSGSVRVNISVTKSLSFLLLHSVNLTVNASSLVILKKHFYLDQWDLYDKSRNLSVGQTAMNISFSSPLPTGQYSLSMEYSGYYQSSMAGFAKVKYHFKNETKFLAVTGMGATDARKVFPCFDTLGYRTPFQLHITVRPPHWPISNVNPSASLNQSDDTRTISFTNYPSMTVNQLAWAVIDQTSYALSEDTSTDTTIHTRAPPLHMNQTVWANHLTARLLQAAGNFTGVPFSQTNVHGSSHNKLEQIVLPEFFTGTSEGYAFMCFSEEMLLVSESKSSTKDIQDVALTLARHVIKLWYGDVASINSWDNFWMMTGIQQYLQIIIAESLPEMSDWQLREQAVVDLTQKALGLDSADGHPLTAHSDDESQLVTTVSDSLTRYKGGAIIRMLADIFGNTFKEAMNIFFMSSFKNPEPVTPANFWDILYSVASDRSIDLADQSLEDIMQEWISTPGYPVLNVSTNSSHFTISQSNTSQWWVPVSYAVQGSPSVSRTWLPPGGALSVPASSAKWILLNINQTSFYRVNYSPAMWQVLSNQLRTDLSVVPSLSRAQLVDDVFSSDLVVALEFTGFLQAETDYFTWATALIRYQSLIYSVAGHSSYQLLQGYLLELMDKVIAQVDFTTKPEDSHVDRLKRSLVLEKACQFGHQKCIQKAVTDLRTWMAQTYYDQDLSPALLCAGVANSSADVWHNIWSMYHLSLYPNIRVALLQSLTCTKDKYLLYQLLNNITSKINPSVNVKDKNILLQTLSSKPFGANVLLNWLVDRLHTQTNTSGEMPTEAPTATAEPTTIKPNTTGSPNTTSNATDIDDTTTPSSNETTVQSRAERLTATNITNMTSADDAVSSTATTTVAPPENLTETDIITILNLIAPMLTTMEEGTKLDKFVGKGNKTGLSNATLEIMKNIIHKIYIQADKVMGLNQKLTSWLESEATSTTSSGGSTKTSTQMPSGTTAAPSSASGLRLPSAVLLAACLPSFRTLLSA